MTGKSRCISIGSTLCALAALCMLTPSLARAQDYCASTVSDGWAEIDNTCLVAEGSQVEAYISGQTTGTLNVQQIVLRGQLYDGGALVWDDATTGSDNFLFTPVSGHTYTLYTSLDECQSTGAGDYGDCTWVYNVLQTSVSHAY